MNLARHDCAVKDLFGYECLHCGAADSSSDDWKILQWLGFESRRINAAEVVISAEVIEQILRVARRLRNKDWAGSVVARIWQNLNLFDLCSYP